MEDEKDLIIEAIEAISDGGNNTASEVREVLTRILNYTENKKPFKIHTKSPVESNGNTLSYSFRGHENNFSNLTFDLTINNPNEPNIYSFIFQEDQRTELVRVLKTIVKEGEALYFVIPLNMTLEGFVDQTLESTLFYYNVKIQFVNAEQGITFDFLGIRDQIEVAIPNLPDVTDNMSIKINSKTAICFHMPN